MKKIFLFITILTSNFTQASDVILIDEDKLLDQLNIEAELAEIDKLLAQELDNSEIEAITSEELQESEFDEIDINNEIQNITKDSEFDYLSNQTTLEIENTEAEKIIDKQLDDLEKEFGIHDDISSMYKSNTVSLRVLNKITAKTEILNTNIGDVAIFGNLDVIVEKCWTKPENEKHDARAKVEIYEKKQISKNLIFSDWLFSKSISITGLNHPIYDVVLLECR